MKWIDFYLILVITAILRLAIKDNTLFILSGLPVGVVLGYLRGKANAEEKRDEK